MKKVAFVLLSSFLLLGACGNNDDSVDNVKKFSQKDNPKAQKIKANQIVQMVKKSTITNSKTSIYGSTSNRTDESKY